jgi:endogenous inhibitor of DNA gyrase (YacG/DUF329 family)
MVEKNILVQCMECKKQVKESEAFYYGETKMLCEECFDKKADSTQQCPNCGTNIDQQAESVGLLLTPIGSTAEQKKSATDVLVIVCPNCKILFFDDFQYNIMQGLKRM